MSADLQVNWKSLGGLKVVKVGEQKELLQGAVFEVMNSANEKVGTMTTNEQGSASLSGLEIGTYTLKEMKSPTGYVLNGQPQQIEVKTGEVTTITVQNTQVKGNIEIKKLSDSGKTLPKVEFTVYTAEGKEITKTTTNEQGIAQVKDIPYGNNKLPNAEFTIFNEKGEEVLKGKTDQNGIAKFKLPYGKYTYKETFAPEGYLLNEEIFSFEIKEDGQIIKHTVKDQKKPTPPTPEKPQQIVMKPQLEQTPKKIETYLPTTGGKAENPYIRWMGLVCVALGLIGAVFVVRNRKKVQ